MGSFSVGETKPLLRGLTEGVGHHALEDAVPARNCPSRRPAIRCRGHARMDGYLAASVRALRDYDAICTPAMSRTGLLPKLVLQFANTVDCNGDDIDGLFHRADADRGAAAHQVARQQRHIMRDLADELLGAEDHVRNWIVLTLDPVENGSHHKLRGVDRRSDDGPERAEVVISFGARPL